MSNGSGDIVESVYTYLKTGIRFQEFDPGQLFRNMPSLLHAVEEALGKDLERSELAERYSRVEEIGLKFLVPGRPELLSVCEAIFEAAYGGFCIRQLARDERHHKGAPLYQVGLVKLFLGQRAAAKRSFELAYIEDLLTHGDAASTQLASAMLSNELRVNHNELRALAALVKARLDGNPPPFYPEELWLRYVDTEANRAVRDSSALRFDINRTLAAEWKSNLDIQQDANEKGRLWELLVSYLFSCVPGFEVRRRVSTPDAEYDLIVRNSVSDPMFQEFGDFLIVECKNWSKPVDSQAIEAFAGKLQAAQCRCGVLVSALGITGARQKDQPPEAQAAASRRNKLFQRDPRTVILVLTNKDIDDLCSSGGTTLPSLLLDEYWRVRFDM